MPPRADVDVDRLDLAALPDPRPSVTATTVITRRVLDVTETASRRFASSHATVDGEVIAFEQIVATKELDRRALPSRAGAVVAVLDRLTEAVAEAELQHDRNLAVLALFERAVAQLARSTHPPDVRAAVGYRDRTGELIVANGDLTAAMIRARSVLPACVAATARTVQAAGIVSRRLFVADVRRQLAYARTILDTALAQRQALAAQEAGLVAMIERFAQRTGQALPLPAVVWPSGGTDPFAGPTLAD